MKTFPPSELIINSDGSIFHLHITPEQLADKVLYEAGVFITPGFIFGKNGEDYVRISLCAKPEVLKKAADLIRQI